MRVRVAFRSSYAAAPLKLRSGILIDLQVRSFRSSYAAAPLKRGNDLVGKAPPLAFRSSYAAAPLKLARGALDNPERVRLPQLLCCGPIEAFLRPPHTSWGAAFRSSYAAAPLKLKDQQHRRRHQDTFRSSYAAAPLKLLE